MEDRCIDSRIQEELSRYFGCPENNLSIRLSFDDGKSGDQVFLLTVVSPPNPTQAGEYILKIRKSNTPERFRTEIHNSIVAKSTDNGRIHIPEIINYSSEGDFYLCAVAGNGAGETSSLYSQETEKKRSRFGEFMGLSMFEWSPCTNMKSDHPANLAFEWLGDERLSINSRMAKRLRELIEDELTPAWQLDNRTLPNPFYFFVASARDDSSAFVDNFMRGRQHGDLNQTNILIQSDSTTRQFYLIDFFDYKPETYLFYDQAYLLLDILLDIHGVLLVEWIQFVEDFMNTSTTDLSNSKHSASLTLLNKYSTTFWGEWKRFSSRYPHNSKAMTKQLLCAFASAGLNYINKSLSNKNKQIYALVFSSIAMEMLIRDKTFLEYDHNIDYPILRTADSNVIPEIWNITDGFSALGRYILISSCDPNKINTEAFCSLAPIPWTAIIEINGQLKNDLRSTALSRFRMKQGYSTVLLSKVQESNEPEKESIWCSIILDDIEKNKKLYFNRFIRNRFLNSLSKTLSQQEKYPLVVLVDSDGIDPAIVDFILTDILTVAGDNTPISIIGLSNTDLELEEDTWIKVYKLPCELNEISRNVQLTFKPIETPNVQIPSVNGMIPLDSGIISEIETDMQIIHRRLSSNSADDQGDIFFHGGEPSWYDIAYSRDVERTSYTEEWRGRIEQKLRHASSTSVVRLYHRPGGGGTTMARRIMWDFCSSYPTVLLKKVSDRTSEKMKLLSTASSGMPILVATELPDSSISELRMELIRRNVRALFICVSRCNERIDTRSNSFYLPDTPQMYLATASEDARFLCRRFCERLDPDKDSERINDLQELTYLQNKYGDEIRQPFFYGLFAFGQDYKKLDEYVSRNIDLNNDQELLLLKILSLMSKYSQTLNLNIVEVAHILFLCKPLNASYIAEARLRLSKNCFIVKRNDGYRISHPLIASAILDELIPAGNGLVTLAEQTISTIGRIYSDDSPRLNEIFYELFIYRAPLTDDGQRKVFSDFITDLPNDKQRIHVMECLENTYASNPHYSNHLARLYLKPLDENRQPKLKNAEKYALEAIKKADKLPEDGGSVHHHLLGKVYARECYNILRRQAGNHVTSGFSAIENTYRNAVREFDYCCAGRNASYGLVGKLELINGIFDTVWNVWGIRVCTLISKEQSLERKLNEMISTAGDIIHQYTVALDEADEAFQRAKINLYKHLGMIKDIEKILTSNNLGMTPGIRAKSRRSIVTIYESQAAHGEGHLYDRMSLTTLDRIKALMEQNIYEEAGNNSDRFRWIEASRRLDDFDLQKMYEFVLGWPDADSNIDIIYYRYVFSFLLYAKSRGVSYASVKEHINQCITLSQKSYGKNVTLSRDMMGWLDPNSPDKISLVTWKVSDFTVSQAEREQENKEYRENNCQRISGLVSRVKGGMVDIHFSMENTGNTIFMAQSPKVDEINWILEGQYVNFHLGFSYQGFRAWDIELSK